MEARVSFRILAKGVEMGCNGLLGGKRMILLEANTHLTDKLRDPRVYIFPDQEHIVRPFV